MLRVRENEEEHRNGEKRKVGVKSLSMSCDNRKRGFTLIELMIVILIIGIIAALAIPRFTRATAKAKKREAFLVLKQIYELENAYYQENGIYSPSNGPNQLHLVGWDTPSQVQRYDYTVTAGATGNLTTSMHIIATERTDADLDGTQYEEIIMNELGQLSGDVDW